MFITKRYIPRRTFLRGAGVTLALPFLEAMVPAFTPLRLTAAAPIRRFVGIWHPHGAAPGYWSPLQTGKDFEFSFITKPLEPFRNRTVLISGLDMPEAMATDEEPGGDHARGAVLLSGARPRRNAVSPYLGVTIDQLIAMKYGQDNILSSIQLGVEDSGNFGNCNWGYSCAYTNSISWPTQTRPLPMEINPQVVFQRLFGDGSTQDERSRRRAEDESILDSVTETLARFKSDISVADRTRVDQYVEDVREIERRLQIAAKASSVAPTMTMPYGVPESFDEHIRLQFDLLTLAFQGDITRVSTLLYARDLTGRVYPESGTNISFHGGSHHAEDPKRIEEYAVLNRYHVKMLAYFIDKLQKTPDGDGTLLDHSLVLYGSNMGNSNQHLHYDVPHVLVGKASGKLKGGRHLAFPSHTVPTGNLLVSILDMFGVREDAIGDSTGRLPGLA